MKHFHLAILILLTSSLLACRSVAERTPESESAAAILAEKIKSLKPISGEMANELDAMSLNDVMSRSIANTVDDQPKAGWSTTEYTFKGEIVAIDVDAMIPFDPLAGTDVSGIDRIEYVPGFSASGMHVERHDSTGKVIASRDMGGPIIFLTITKVENISAIITALRDNSLRRSKYVARRKWLVDGKEKGGDLVKEDEFCGISGNPRMKLMSKQKEVIGLICDLKNGQFEQFQNTQVAKIVASLPESNFGKAFY